MKSQESRSFLRRLVRTPKKRTASFGFAMALTSVLFATDRASADTPGITGWEIVQSPAVQVAAANALEVEAFCSPGKQILGGGAKIHDNQPPSSFGYLFHPPSVIQSNPSAFDNGWHAMVRNPTGGAPSITFHVEAVCANPVPGWEKVRSDLMTVAAGNYAYSAAYCSIGKYPISGGGFVVDQYPSPVGYAAFPPVFTTTATTTNYSPTTGFQYAWFANVDVPAVSGATVSFYAYAICIPKFPTEWPSTPYEVSSWDPRSGNDVEVGPGFAGDVEAYCYQDQKVVGGGSFVYEDGYTFYPTWQQHPAVITQSNPDPTGQGWHVQARVPLWPEQAFVRAYAICVPISMPTT